MKFTKIKQYLAQVSSTFKRFPVAVGLLSFYTLYVILQECFHSELFDYRKTHIHVWLSLYPVLAALLSVVLKNLREISVGMGRHAAIFCHGALLVVTILMAIFYESFASLKFFHLAATIAFALFFGLCIFPTSKHKNEETLWNSLVQMEKSLGLALPVSIACWMLFAVYLLCVGALFGLKLNWKIYAYGATFCSLFMFPVLFLAGFPYLRDCEGTPAFSKSRKLLSNIGSVILLFYVLLLYAYTAKILLTWTLPKGSVVYVVSIAVLFAMIVWFSLYPAKFHPELKLQNRLQKYIPAALLPLLVLMTVGIGRRVFDYGLTVPRIYAIALNVWFYVALGILFARRIQKKIWWTSTTFGAVLVLLCLVPFDLNSSKRSYEVSRTHVNSARIGERTQATDSAQLDSLKQIKNFYYKTSIDAVLPVSPNRTSFFRLRTSVMLQSRNIRLENDTLFLKFSYDSASSTEFRIPTSMMMDSTQYYTSGFKNMEPLVIDNGDATLVLTSARFKVRSGKCDYFADVDGFVFLE